MVLKRHAISIVCYLGMALFAWPSLAMHHDVAPHDTASFDRQALVRAASPPLGLPPLPVPAENPLTLAKIRLGRKLLFDRRLSLNNTMSCAMCHIPEQGFTVNELAQAVGIGGRSVRRNVPTLINVAYMRALFHDGRETGLETQVISPLMAPNEMANPSMGYLVERIERLADYRGLFEQAFKRGPSVETIGQAMASYERTLLSANSRFDRWYYGNQPGALSAKAQAGFQLFVGDRARCVTCHTITAQGALFTDNAFHNTGLGWFNSMVGATRKTPTRVQLAPGIFTDLAPEVIASVGESRPSDLGRYEVTRLPADRWRYRTPSLRNVALTAPYMHDGSLSTLDEVVRFYNRGGHPHPWLDPRIRPLHLTEMDIGTLVAFLESLTGDNLDELIADARGIRVGNIRTD